MPWLSHPAGLSRMAAGFRHQKTSASSRKHWRKRMETQVQPLQLKFNQLTADDSERFLSSNLTSELTHDVDCSLIPLGSHLTIHRTKHQDANRQFTSIESADSIFRSKNSRPGFFVHLELKLVLPILFGTKPSAFLRQSHNIRAAANQKVGMVCHQPPYEHPKSVINNKIWEDFKPWPNQTTTVFFCDFWVSKWCCFFRLSTPHLNPTILDRWVPGLQRQQVVEKSQKCLHSRPGQQMKSDELLMMADIRRCNQLRLVVSPIICRVLAPSKRWLFGSSSINSRSSSEDVNANSREKYHRFCFTFDSPSKKLRQTISNS